MAKCSRTKSFLHGFSPGRPYICAERYNTSMKNVLVGGGFDLLHFGHISFLKQAKALGDHLIVALESDETVRRLKNEHRPIHTQQQRREMLESLSVVDEVLQLPPMTTDQEYFDFVKKVAPAV